MKLSVLRHHFYSPAEIHKSALGAENSVDWVYFEDTLEAIKELKTKGFEVLAIEQAEGSTLLNQLEINPVR